MEGKKIRKCSKISCKINRVCVRIIFGKGRLKKLSLYFSSLS
jgi:hypothetical protein